MGRLAGIGLQMTKSKYAHVNVSNEGADNSYVVELGLEALELENEFEIAEQVSNVIGSLESLAAEAEASIAEGGLDRFAGGLLQVAAEAQLGRVGIGAEGVVASVESFGGSGTRTEATTVSVESIKDAAKNLWKWLVKKYKEIREKVLKWFKKIFSGAAQLKARAEKVAKKAVDSKSTLKDDADDSIEIGGAAKYLSTGVAGKVDIPALAANVAKMKDVANATFQDHGERIKDAADGVEKLLETANGLDKDKWEKGGADIALLGGVKNFKASDLIDEAAYTTGGTFLGARDLTGPKASEISFGTLAEAKTSLDKVTIKFEAAKGSDGKAIDFDEDATFKPIEPNKVKDIAEDVVVLAEAVLAYESRYYKYQKDLEKMEKAAEKLAKSMDKYSPNTGGAAANKVCGAFYEMVMRLNSNPSAQFTAAVMGSGKAALDVCDKSLAQYES